ncbi:MAG: FHA domain-containing protein [Planctomycetota bacterium]|nr:FHA domain-containing protein [Planctomycetota bacterium]
MSLEAKLTVVGGKASKRTVALQLPTSIGRSRDADLTVPHPQISRKHCELVEADGLILVRDAGSLNGTYVNSHRVKEASLPPDATFSIGPLTFRVRYQYDGDPSDLPPTIQAEEQSELQATGAISETLPSRNEPLEELEELVIEDLAEEEAVGEGPAKEDPKEAKSLPEAAPAEKEAKSDPGDDALDDFLKGLT